MKFSLLSAAPVLANWLLYDPLCGHNRGSDGGFGLATTTTTTRTTTSTTTTVGQREGMGWFSLAIVAGILEVSDISILVQSKLYLWRKLKRWQIIFCLTSSFQILDCFRAVYWIFLTSWQLRQGLLQFGRSCGFSPWGGRGHWTHYGTEHKSGLRFNTVSHSLPFSFFFIQVGSVIKSTSKMLALLKWGWAHTHFLVAYCG